MHGDHGSHQGNFHPHLNTLSVTSDAFCQSLNTDHVLERERNKTEVGPDFAWQSHGDVYTDPCEGVHRCNSVRGQQLLLCPQHTQAVRQISVGSETEGMAGQPRAPHQGRGKEPAPSKAEGGQGDEKGPKGGRAAKSHMATLVCICRPQASLQHPENGAE